MKKSIISTVKDNLGAVGLLVGGLVVAGVGAMKAFKSDGEDLYDRDDYTDDYDESDDSEPDETPEEATDDAE